MEHFTLYTIGHSNQSFEEFLHMLYAQDIGVIVDVRSVPASKYTPQFNKEILQVALKRAEITYLSFASEFGARRTDSLDVNGRVNFERAVQTSAFVHGVERLNVGLSKGYRIALMCSEANPLECHRFSMISRYFYEHGVDVQHIIKHTTKEGEVHILTESHKQLQDAMIAEYVKKKKIPIVSPPDMFGENEVTPEQQIVLAYRQKNKEIAYQQQTDNDIYI